MTNLDAFIDALPKAETHIHIEGTVPWSIARHYATDATEPDWLHPDFRFTDFDQFGSAMMLGVLHLQHDSLRHYADVAAACFRHLAAQNVRYVEVTLGMGPILRGDAADPAEVVAAVHAAAPAGMHVRVIGGVNRRFVHPLDGPEARAVLDTPGIVGIDLQSDERANGPCAFTDLYDAARERGYLLRAHAGELSGPQIIADTLDCLGVSRIMHGTTAIHDEALVVRLAADPTITLDMCPTSNVRLRVVDSLESHPIGELLRRGVQVTCSTDDPAIFDITLTDELRQLVTHQSFTARELAALQINAFRAALLPEAERQSLIAEVEALVTQFEAAD